MKMRWLSTHQLSQPYPGQSDAGQSEPGPLYPDPGPLDPDPGPLAHQKYPNPEQLKIIQVTRESNDFREKKTTCPSWDASSSPTRMRGSGG